MAQVYAEAPRLSNELDMNRLKFSLGDQNGASVESSVKVTVFDGGGRSM